MTKFSVLIAGLFFLSAQANASDINRFNNQNITRVNDYGNNPITFTEGGIVFNVYPNGQFDYNLPPAQSVVYGNYGRRGLHVGLAVNVGSNVMRDYYGKVIRVGNVPLIYDPNNRILQIGNVMMGYNGYGLTQVGGLQLIYDNNYNIVQVVGSVNVGYVVNNSYPVYNANYGYNRPRYAYNVNVNYSNYHPNRYYDDHYNYSVRPGYDRSVCNNYNNHSDHDRDGYNNNYGNHREIDYHQNQGNINQGNRGNGGGQGNGGMREGSGGGRR